MKAIGDIYPLNLTLREVRTSFKKLIGVQGDARGRVSIKGQVKYIQGYQVVEYKAKHCGLEYFIVCVILNKIPTGRVYLKEKEEGEADD